ncbi:MAG: hypothetical protein H6R43_691, partial [Nitrospirae bacterium]|nr:hypothetical protein [Nitrospirota bacterium]
WLGRSSEIAGDDTIPAIQISSNTVEKKSADD